MKKIISSIIFIFIIGSSLISCQKMPEKRVVVDRSEGLPEESIISKEEKGIPKDLGIPEHWEETLTKNDGFITLTADYEFAIPEIYNTPIYSYEIRSMEQEFLEKLCMFFSDGNSLYEEAEMTKNELLKEKDNISNQKGAWGFYNASNYGDFLNTLIGRIDLLIERAPEDKVAHNYIDVELTVPKKSGMELIQRPWSNATHKRQWHEWYYETDDKIGFTARVEKGKKVNPILRATNYDDEIGSTTAFIYKQGTFIDEIELSLEWKLENTLNNGNDSYLTYLSNEMDYDVDDAFTQEDAIREAKKVLDDLSIEGIVVTDCVKAIGEMESESWAGLEEGIEKSKGYAVYLSLEAGDVAGYPLPSTALPYEALAETTYAPAFRTEGIRIIVTKEGIQLFEWTDISKKIDTIAKNTAIMPFEEVKEKLVDHLFYTQVANLGGISQEGFINLYTVQNVQLRAANINAYEDPMRAWLVPIWKFEVESVMSLTTQEGAYETNSGPEIVVLNAIDGGYVQVQMDW
jgi:hypothetical protein